MIISNLPKEHDGKLAAIVVPFTDGWITKTEVILVQQAKKLCDELLVFVQSDYWINRIWKPELIAPMPDRLFLADSIKGVDYVYGFDKADPQCFSGWIDFFVWLLTEEAPKWTNNVVFVRG